MALMVGCQNGQQDGNVSKSNAPEQIENSPTVEPILLESFEDSTTIGKKGLNKILLQYYQSDSFYVVLNFYAKYRNEWALKRTFQTEKDGVAECRPNIIDFNNDGYNDFTYVSGVAPRGANEIRDLFIYDALTNDLVFIKNSNYFPNIQYNGLINCVDSWAVSSGSSTKFLSIEHDSFRMFAEVAAMDGELNIYTYNKDGMQKLEFNKTIEEEDVFIRYKNYKPLVENVNSSY